MLIAPFEYVAARSLEHALDLLELHGEGAALLAGGHSLLPLMKRRQRRPAVLIDLGRVGGLDRVEPGAAGALATHARLAACERIPELLSRCAASIGDRQVRHRGTLGGALVQADPAGDYPAALLALEARVCLVSRRGRRELGVDEFLGGAFRTAREPGEILTEVRWPEPPRGGVYLKRALLGSGYTLCGVAVAGQGRVGTRVALNGIAARAYRARAVEEALARGASPQEASALACQGVEVLADRHASREYRIQLAQVMTRRALLACPGGG